MDQKKLAIIATKGTLDSAYPPFILASTAAALGYQVQIFSLSTACNCCARILATLKSAPWEIPLCR